MGYSILMWDALQAISQEVDYKTNFIVDLKDIQKGKFMKNTRNAYLKALILVLLAQSFLLMYIMEYFTIKIGGAFDDCTDRYGPGVEIEITPMP